jgi:hypothetical protein
MSKDDFGFGWNCRITNRYLVHDVCLAILAVLPCPFLSGILDHRFKFVLMVLWFEIAVLAVGLTSKLVFDCGSMTDL